MLPQVDSIPRPLQPPSACFAAAFQRFVHRQVAWSRDFDRILPEDYRLDGNRDFLDRVVPRYLSPGLRVYDVGGGKNPVIDPATKSRLGLIVTGLDIDDRELRSAPVGAYDRTLCGDIGSVHGEADADLVICQALLEHVPDTGRALQSIAGILKPGGRALLFVPSRNAVYARLNLLIAERIKRAILFAIYPEMTRDHGFPAFYDGCTPAAFAARARRAGLECETRNLYFQSDYFRFCLPLHVMWRAWMALFRACAGTEAAETFTLVLRKPGGAAE